MRRVALALALLLVAPACGSESTTGVLDVTAAAGAPARQLTAEALAGLRQVELEAFGRRYTGPRLRDALAAAGAPADASVAAVAADGYAQTLSAETVARGDVIVAHGLGADEGPLRLIVPGSPGLSLKRLAAVRPAG